MNESKLSGDGYVDVNLLHPILGVSEAHMVFIWDVFSINDTVADLQEVFTAAALFSGAELPDKSRFLLAAFDTSGRGMLTAKNLCKMARVVVDVLIKCIGGVPKHIKGKYVAESLRQEIPSLIPTYQDALKHYDDPQKCFETEELVGSMELKNLLGHISDSYKRLPLSDTSRVKIHHVNTFGGGADAKLDYRVADNVDERIVLPSNNLQAELNRLRFKAVLPEEELIDMIMNRPVRPKFKVHQGLVVAEEAVGTEPDQPAFEISEIRRDLNESIRRRDSLLAAQSRLLQSSAVAFQSESDVGLLLNALVRQNERLVERNRDLVRRRHGEEGLAESLEEEQRELSKLSTKVYLSGLIADIARK